MKKFLLSVLVIAFIFAASCKKQDIRHNDFGSIDSTDSVDSVVFTDEPSIRGNYSDIDINLQNIYFDFDKNDLTEDSMEILKKNADYLESNSDIKVVLEGHTDERGTTEYNLSLGQRRALRVKEYYMQLGVAANRIATTSYGHEKPVDFRKNELGWAKNRRVETKLLVRQK
jgi:peptidoglycan-associated lipoprotein